ncbi:transposase [Mannheimia haemolytica]|nr:transposase [Mannheimia haemolytica]
MRKSRLSQYKQNKLIEQFVAGVTARTASELVNVNKNTAAYYFHRLRLLIYQHSPHLEMFEGEIEVDNLRKFNGIPKVHFELYLYLKECEWRFNHSDLKSQISFLKQLVKGSLG